jgi:triacylglycerol lipase
MSFIEKLNMSAIKNPSVVPTKKSAPRSVPRTAQPAVSQNSYPFVLVHGLGGWGRDELFGQNFRYWGGAKGDIQEHLKSQGYETFTATMGPLSSNWDRACELYTFIRGGVVDYGAAHSARYGHARYGRSYPGVYPQWSDANKLHLIGHSMGGPTSRTLIQLLEQGDPDEAGFKPGPREAPSSDLFNGGKRWVHSLTSIAGVHNGTLTADDVQLFPTFIKDFLFGVAALAGVASAECIYDFNLQQWGLEREKGQGVADYIRRAMESRVWTSSDACTYDLSTVAAHFQNAWARTSDQVYYNAYAVDGTFAGPQGIHVPLPNMNDLLKVPSAAIGLNEKDFAGGYTTWRPNDGLVSVPSAQYPIGHAHAAAEPGEPADPQKGIWYVHPTLMGKDHLSIVIPFHEVTADELHQFYEGIAKYSWALPA